MDEELRQRALPYRAAVLLCDLEGLSRVEPARQLRIPASTLRTRLARGRKLLYDRLVRRGVTLSAGAIAATAKVTQSTAAIIPALIEATTTKAVLFAAGKSAAKIGITTAVAKAALGEITAMKVTKFSMIGAAALAIVFGGTAVESLTGIVTSMARAETIFFDDFTDGNAQDGMPVTWQGVAGGTMSVVTDPQNPEGGESLRRTAADTNIASVPSVRLTDTSLRTQFRLIEGAFAGVMVRNDWSRQGIASYSVFISETGTLGLAYGKVGTILQRATNPTLIPSQQDIVMQVDAFGDRVQAWVWAAGDPMPETPVFDLIDTVLSEGEPSVFVFGPGRQNDGLFRYVHVADTHIPEPSTATLSAILFAGVFGWQWRRRW